MPDEPRNHPLYLIVLALVAAGTVPVAFVGSNNPRWIGLPLWLWSSLGFTLALSAVTVWGILRYWEVEEEEVRESECSDREGDG